MKNFCPLIFIFVLALLLPLPAAALRLDEAVSLALANHQQIARARADVAISAANEVRVQSSFWPRLDLSYNYSQSKQLAFGGTDKLSTLRVGAGYNLFNGFADRNALDAASRRHVATNYLLRATTADIILSVHRAYIDVLRAQRTVATAAESVELLQRQQRDDSLRLAQGMIARNDLLRIEVELSNARQDLLRAEGRQRLARHTLERVVGKTLVDQSVEEITDNFMINTELNDNRRKALRQRSEVRYLEELVTAAQHDVTAARGGYLPRVDLSLSHENYGDSAAPSGRDLSYDDDTIVAVNASWNLFAGRATSQAVVAAEALKASLWAQLNDTRAEVLLQLQSALEDARIAEGRLREAAVGVTQAEENYRVTENRRKYQQSTVVDLLDAQFLLTRARNLEADAQYDLLLSKAVVDRVLEQNQPSVSAK